MPAPLEIRVLTWNLFHGRDGAGLGPTPGSIVLNRPVDDGERIHLNRKWIPQMASVIDNRAPVIAALQEVPPLAVDELARLTGMQAAHSLMPPLVGSTRLRGRLAARNPDLWQTHEGTANVLLIAPPWQIVPGGSWTVRHNPPWFVARHLRRLGLPRHEAVHWLLEPRRLVAARLRHPSGATVTAVSLHCHNSAEPRLVAAELRRVIPKVVERIPDHEPLLVAGDFNASGPAHPAVQEMVRLGLREDSVEALNLDHIFHRDVRVVTAPHRVDRAARELSITWKGRARLVVLSDHDPVEATYELPGAPTI